MTKLPAVPEGYNTVTSWIIAKNASALVRFIEKVFHAKEKPGSRMLNRDGSLAHVEVQLDDSIIMLFDSPEQWPTTPAFLRIYVDDARATIARAQQHGGKVVTKLTPLFFGDNVARIRDQWGNIWWIQERVARLKPAQVAKRMTDPQYEQNMRYVQSSLARVMNSGPANG